MTDFSRDLLSSEALARDPRVAEAKRLLNEAVKEHQKNLTGIRPAEASRKQAYADLIEDFARCRGYPLYFPYVGSGMGNGVFVELRDGSVKYDFITGIGSFYWGHSHEALRDACIDAALSDTVMQGNLQQNKDSYDLMKLFLEASKMDHCFLTATGAGACENALKIIFQKKYPAIRLLAFDRCFMGRTLALSQITDKAAFREGLPPTLDVDYIPFFDPENPDMSTERAVAALKKQIARHPKDYAAMCIEMIQGEGGFHRGTSEFFRAIMTVLRDHGIAVFADEVQTFGRTYAPFAFQYFGLDEFVDVVSIGKLSQVCATLFKKEFNPRPGLLGQTFTGSTSAIRAGYVIVRTLLDGGYFGPEGKIAVIHDYFKKRLEELSQRMPSLIRGPYGIGAMIAFTPFEGRPEKTASFVRELFDAGVMSFVAGSNPTRVRFLIPMGAIATRHIDDATAVVEQTLLKMS